MVAKKELKDAEQDLADAKKLNNKPSVLERLKKAVNAAKDEVTRLRFSLNHSKRAAESGKQSASIVPRNTFGEGLADNQPHSERTETLHELVSHIRQHKVALCRSSPGTGKTSLCQLLEPFLKKQFQFAGVRAIFLLPFSFVLFFFD